MNSNAHYKLLITLFYTFDNLIKQAHYHSKIRALTWLKRFRTDIVFDSLYPNVHDAQLATHECNKHIIENFKDCFYHSLIFLKEYAQTGDITNESLINKLYKKKIITSYHYKSLLWTIKNIDTLCNACDEQGKFIVSTKLIESYRVIHEIVIKLNL